MKLKIPLLLIVCSILSNQLLFAGDIGRGTIRAKATVVPMFGFTAPLDNSQMLRISDPNDSTLFIQAPKNSELLVTLSSLSKHKQESYLLNSKHSVLSRSKNSVIDLMTLDLHKRESTIITVVRIDN